MVRRTRSSTRVPIFPRLVVGVAALASLGAACGGQAKAARDEATPMSATEAPVVPSTSAPEPTTAAPTTTTTARPTGSLAGKVIVIDPGHNGGNAAHATEINRTVDAGNGVQKACDTTGTASSDGWPEYAFTMELSNALAQKLRAAGATVRLTHADTSGWGPCITERAAIGNNAGATLAISIHADGNTDAGARGYHVIVPTAMAGGSGTVEKSSRFGTLVRDRMLSTGMPASNYIGSNGINARGDLGGLNLSTVPKVFVEFGNMRNASDLALLHDPTWQARAADALVAAMGTYLAAQ